MTHESRNDVGEELYEEGMKYNWRQSESPANAALSRATLERAAATGHTKAIREVAEMMFQGSGGPKNQEHALWLKWSAFVRGDSDALEELSALLESYAESMPQPNDRQRASDAARKTEEAAERLAWLQSYLHGVARLSLANREQ